ncbi:Putative RING-H2 finger protein ATL21B [Apostasia shenzhenica]|uniref:RING-H2 finger protein ATL21B n=1 Tax=Apostasia shenzhenica TaxID=1088818 RepID=A0A2H9ZTK4_9ASPA|nr:Putative RING-H2 finger protein ATL21B [Apostasia shenzhenica]
MSTHGEDDDSPPPASLPLFESESSDYYSSTRSAEGTSSPTPAAAEAETTDSYWDQHLENLILIAFDCMGAMVPEILAAAPQSPMKVMRSIRALRSLVAHSALRYCGAQAEKFATLRKTVEGMYDFLEKVAAEQLQNAPPPEGIAERRCPVCLEEFIPPVYRLANCGHHYHPQCILTWLHISNCCPVCRVVAFRHGSLICSAEMVLCFLGSDRESSEAGEEIELVQENTSLDTYQVSRARMPTTLPQNRQQFIATEKHSYLLQEQAIGSAADILVDLQKLKPPVLQELGEHSIPGLEEALGREES